MFRTGRVVYQHRLVVFGRLRSLHRQQDTFEGRRYLLVAVIGRNVTPGFSRAY